MAHKQPKPKVQTTTLWDFPSQHYGDDKQGDGDYQGVTPSYIIWNLLHRYTKPKDKVLDPMCGSGTTLDVCKDLDRQGIGFDLQSRRPDIKAADARKLPVADGDIDFVFVDPPYSDHIDYSDNPDCIGKLDARSDDYFGAIEQVLSELHRVLKPGGYISLYIQDSFAKGKSFMPLGFEVFLRMSGIFAPVDIVAVTRHHKKLKRNHWHTSAIEGNFMLRGFNYLFIMRKPKAEGTHDHEDAGTLSTYFKAVSRREEGVTTPETLAHAMEANKEELDRHVDRKERKKAWRASQKAPGKKKARTGNTKRPRSRTSKTKKKRG